MSPEDLRVAMDALAEEAQAAGRSAADVPVSISLPMQAGRAGRYSLGTEPTEMVEKLLALHRVGAETVVISPFTGDAQAMARGLEVLTQEVIPAVQSAA